MCLCPSGNSSPTHQSSLYAVSCVLWQFKHSVLLLGLCTGSTDLSPSGCSIKMPWPGWLVNKGHLFLMVLEIASRSSLLWIWCLLWLHVLLHAHPSLHCGSTQYEGWCNSVGPLWQRHQSPFMRAPPPWPNHLSKTSSPNTSHWGLGF